VAAYDRYEADRTSTPTQARVDDAIERRTYRTGRP